MTEFETEKLETPNIEASVFSHAALAGCLGNLGIPIWIFDIDKTRVVWANSLAIDLWQAESLEDLIARDMTKDMSVAVRTRLRQHQEDFESNTGFEFNEIWTIYPHGEPTTLIVRFSGIALPDGRMGMMCEARKEDEQLPETVRSAEALLHTTVMISQFSLNGAQLYSNPSARANHRDPNEILANRFADPAEYAELIEHLTKHGECRMSARVHTASGICWHEITARECRDVASGDRAYLITEIDISDLKETERRVRYLADHDVLTGLPNRNFIQARLPRSILEASTHGGQMVFMMLDLDRFKSINDTLGHAAGDELLVKVSARLKRVVGDLGLVARFGGDEFLIVLKSSEILDDGRDMRQILLRIFRDPIIIRGHRFVVTPSIGISRFPTDGSDLSTLLVNADLALYEAKEQGRNTFVSFNPSLQQRVEEQLQLDIDLKVGIEEKQFELYYQPRVDIATNAIVGAEALIRWRHPKRGLLAPDTFIQRCEETGIINEIGVTVLESVGQLQADLARDGHDLSLSLNLSSRQFSDHRLETTVMGLRHKTGCDPSRIELEITESMLMSENVGDIEQLQAFRSEGFDISIDDFGTGFCNLAYIQRYPITALKIDRSFISDFETNGAVTSLIMSLSRLIGVKAVAEGVETEQQLEWLRSKDCDEYQGYLFSRPVPVDMFRSLLERADDQPEVESNLIALNSVRG